MPQYRSLLPLLGWIVLATPGQAQSERDEIARCRAITADPARLACFDTLATRLGGGPTTAAAAPGTGRWDVQINTSPIDDSKNVYLTLEANEPISAMTGSVQPALLLRCKERQFDAFINWSVYLGLDTTTVLIRVDDAPATSALWDLSTDNESTFHRHPDRFLRALLGHQKLLARVTPYGANPALVSFAIAGLDQAVKPLQEACHIQ